MFQSDNEFGPKSLSHVNRLLDDAFDECGLERFTPEIGEDYRHFAIVKKEER
jgi:hypothetical protein